MDIKKYFRKIREVEAEIPEAHVFVSSLETSDGGKPGVISQVSRELAAKMIVEGRSVLASAHEVETHLKRQETARAEAHKAEMARRIQVAIISDPEVQRIPSQSHSGKR